MEIRVFMQLLNNGNLFDELFFIKTAVKNDIKKN